MADKTESLKRHTIVFLHPDLGIGGAERLVVDAAVGLQNRGHKVVIFTSHCDPQHCFDEARDGTLDVRVRGNGLVPPSILGRFSILCAILRQAHLLTQIALLSDELASLQPDAFFVDQLSAGLPLLRLLVGQKRGQRSDGGRILFYIHFPDLLLARGRARWWKRLYRLPFDALEPWSMGFADALAVNSAFTRSVVADTWPRLAAERTLEVVYPCVEVPEDETNGSGDEKGKEGRQSIAGKATKDGRQEKDAVKTTDEAPPLVWPTPPNTRILLSINRFERKKDIGLALRAFAALPQHLIAPRRSPNTQSSTSKSSSPPPTARLVIAGGYDARVQENVQYHQELCQLAESLGLSHATARTVPSALTAASSPVPHPSQGPSDTPAPPQVLFLLSVPSALKSALLRSATCLLYTPRNEHFGIVPLEAMAAGVPVLAADSGGPRETVVDGVTGWLRDPDDLAAWADVLETVVTSGDDATARADGRRGMTEKQRREMGQAGRRRVRENFSAGSMARRLDDVINDMLAAPPVSRAGAGWLGGIALVLAGTAVAVLGVAVAVVLGRS